VGEESGVRGEESGVKGEELRVVGDARELARWILRITKANGEYKYTLNPQIFRAAISVGSNIVEGRRRTNKEFRRFLDISIGSCDEVKYQLSLYPTDYTEAISFCDRIIGQLVNLKLSLNPKPNALNPKPNTPEAP